MNWYNLYKQAEPMDDESDYNVYKPSSSKLLSDLSSLRQEFAIAAQEVIDGWDGNGDDPDFGSGGCCDLVSQALMNVIVSNFGDIDVEEGGQDGDDHSWVFATRGDEKCGVDIPFNVYEYGGGYNWKKKQGVRVGVDDVAIWKI